MDRVGNHWRIRIVGLRPKVTQLAGAASTQAADLAGNPALSVISAYGPAAISHNMRASRLPPGSPLPYSR